MVKALDARDARVQWLQTRAVAALGVSEAEFGEALYDDDGCEAIRCVRVRGARPPHPLPCAARQGLCATRFTPTLVGRPSRGAPTHPAPPPLPPGARRPGEGACEGVCGGHWC